MYLDREVGVQIVRVMFEILDGPCSEKLGHTYYVMRRTDDIVPDAHKTENTVEFKLPLVPNQHPRHAEKHLLVNVFQTWRTARQAPVT